MSSFLRGPFTLLLVAMSLLTTSSLAQQNPCDDKRYKENVFPNLIITKDIQYGQNVTIAGTMLNLDMDIYEPAGDSLSARPTIVLAHGGSFILGDKSDLDSLCKVFTRMGYVTATINYRKINTLISDSLDVVDVVVKATHDMKAAVRFLREDAATNNTYGIDPQLIFAGGASGGAIMANHLAFMDSTDNLPEWIETIISNNGGFEGNSSSNTNYSSEVQAVLNYSGALKDADWIDSSDPPFYSAHDDMDGVVPYGSSTASGFGISIRLDGSAQMQLAGNRAGVRNQLFTIANSTGHVSYFNGNSIADADTAVSQAARLMKSIICNSALSQDEIDKAPIAIYPNPASDHFRLGDLLNGIYTIDILDLSGRLVTRIENTEVRGHQFDVGALHTGMYLVNVYAEKNDEVYKAKLQIR